MTSALVLSGGGPVGIAWEAGVLAGLVEAGLAPGTVETVIGTSAGSVVGAGLAHGATPDEILALDPRGDDPGSDPAAEPPDIPDELIAAFLGDAEDAEGSRARVGTFALQADVPDEEAFVAAIAARLPTRHWPSGFVCTAVDTDSGAFVTLTADDGVALPRAVAASCAVPGIYPPVTVGARRLMDGGVRSLASADLATGHDRVTVLSLMGPATGDEAVDPMGQRLRDEVAALHEAGARVEVCWPDAHAREAIGPNLLDPSSARAAADAGRVQGRAEAERLAATVPAAGAG